MWTPASAAVWVEGVAAIAAGEEAGGGQEHSDVSAAVHAAVGLIAIACVVGVLTKFVRVPYTAALVLVGLAIAALGAAPPGLYITQDLVLLLFLPPLLFQAGLHLDLDHLRRAWGPVAMLAFPGVIVTSAAVGAAIKPLLGAEFGEQATWQLALLFGVVMAPTDPISVLATFRTAGVPEKLKTVVEGESLFNDGTAVALFAVLKGAVFAAAAIGMHGGGHGVGEADLGAGGVALTFIRMAGLGTLLGLGIGVAAYWLLKHIEDHVLETAITVALCWGTFVLAESILASGVIAVVVAALIVGNYGKVLSMSEETRVTLTGFWDSVDFVLNSVLFLLIGFELSDPALGGVSRLVQPSVLLGAGAVLLALFAARAAVVYPVVLILAPHWPKGWKHVIWWAGLRGSLSLALILGLPASPVRTYMLEVAFIVVLVSLLGQAIAMPWLIRRVGAVPGPGAPPDDDPAETLLHPDAAARG